MVWQRASLSLGEALSKGLIHSPELTNTITCTYSMLIPSYFPEARVKIFKASMASEYGEELLARIGLWVRE